MLDIAGPLVSIGAMGCQKNIAKAIVDAKADYLLAPQDNPKGLCGGNATNQVAAGRFLPLPNKDAYMPS